MARARNIKPGFFENEDLAELPIAARLLFIGLWTQADREGRLEDRPKRIKMQLLPLDDVDSDELLQQLHDGGFIYRYGTSTRRARCKNQCQYIQILKFEKHQSPHCKEKASTIPAPDMPGASTRHTQKGKSDAPPDSLNPDSQNEDIKPLGTSQGDAPKDDPDDYTPEFEELWQSRPRRQGPDNKRKAFKAYRARLREGYTHDEIAQGVRAYKQHLEAQGKLGTEFVKMTATLLGPDKHFADDWKPDKPQGGATDDRFRGAV